jgi:hypothetical protein
VRIVFGEADPQAGADDATCPPHSLHATSVIRPLRCLGFRRLTLKLGRRGRCKDVKPRKTVMRPPVGCSAWFGVLFLRGRQPTHGR